MKKVVLILLFCVSASYAQDHADLHSDTPSQIIRIADKLLAVHDFTISDGRMIVTDIPCQITSGSDTNQFTVSVVCQQNAFREMGIEKINAIILMANQKAQATIGKDSSYKPTEIKMSYNPIIKDWSLTHSFSTQDKDGKIGANLLAMDFDSSGAFKIMKRIL